MTNGDELRDRFAAGTHVAPSADHPNLVSLARALLRLADDPAPIHDPVAAALAARIGAHDHLVFVLIDGLGMNFVEDLPETDVIRIPAGTSLPDAERQIILDTLTRTGGNKTAAARILGIGLRTLYRKLEQYTEDDVEAG